MSIVTSKEEAAEEIALSVVGSSSQDASHEPSEPLARFIIERALRDPRFLAEVPAHIRARTNWFRDRVMLPLLAAMPAVSYEETASDPRKIALMQTPEFFGDQELRRAAGHFPLSDPVGLRNLADLGRRQPNYPKGELLDGMPIAEEKPAQIKSFPIINGRTRSRVCDICRAAGVPLEQETLLVVRDIETIQMMTCENCTQTVFGGAGEEPAAALYRHGKFIER